jgi:hypothetical protein
LYTTGFCCEEGYSFSACSTTDFYARPGGGGAKNGADWANAYDGLPATLQRDRVYWIGAGNYGTGVRRFNTAASGSAGITIRKATQAAHGTEAGWNAAYGTGQATFGQLQFDTGRYTLDGGEPNGIKVFAYGLYGGSGTYSAVGLAASYVVLRNIEIDGGVVKSGSRQTSGSCNASYLSASNIVLDRCDIHNVADDGLEISGVSNIKILHSKIHDAHGCGTDDGPCSGPCFNGHSDGLELDNTSNVEIIGNMVYDIRETSALFMYGRTTNGSGVNSNLHIYDNVFYNPTSGVAVYIRDAVGMRFNNNVVWGAQQGTRYGGLWVGSGLTDLDLYNNILLNISFTLDGTSYDPAQHHVDYNLFGMIDSGEYRANAHDLVGDPRFTSIPLSSNLADHKASNLGLDDFLPTAGSQAIDTGTALSGMPDFDIVGETRPQGAAWDRGPFEVR